MTSAREWLQQNLAKSIIHEQLVNEELIIECLAQVRFDSSYPSHLAIQSILVQLSFALNHDLAALTLAHDRVLDLAGRAGLLVMSKHNPLVIELINSKSSVMLPVNCLIKFVKFSSVDSHQEIQWWNFTAGTKVSKITAQLTDKMKCPFRLIGRRFPDPHNAHLEIGSL